MPKITHNMTHSPEFATWVAMRARCYNPNNISYKHYGGRGIKICERWSIFENFLEDVGKKPPDTSIDRIDGSKDYEPGNVRWATRYQQSMNRKLPVSNKTGYRGVAWNKHDKRYRAAITAFKEYHYLGSRKSPHEAALLYNEAAIKYFGDDAQLNIISKEETPNE